MFVGPFDNGPKCKLSSYIYKLLYFTTEVDIYESKWILYSKNMSIYCGFPGVWNAPQQTRRIDPMLDQRRADVVDGGPTLVQHLVFVSCLQAPHIPNSF